jgi:hypothetical protein
MPQKSSLNIQYLGRYELQNIEKPLLSEQEERRLEGRCKAVLKHLLRHQNDYRAKAPPSRTAGWRAELQTPRRVVRRGGYNR